MAKPHLLLLTPTVPSFTGQGSAMRAGVFLELFLEHYEVSLCVVQLYGRRPFAEDERLLGRCERFVRYAPDELKALDGPIPEFQGIEFAHIHVFRLLMASWMRRVLPPQKNRPRLTLDLDDYESQTQLRFAELYVKNNLHEQAKQSREQATKMRQAEEQIIPFFDSAYVCGEADRASLAKRFTGVKITTVPNVVRLPNPLPAKDAGLYTFLFIGTMVYYPNADAILWFCNEVLPLLRHTTEETFRVMVVGRTSMETAALASLPEVEVLGEVEDLTDCYHAADASIVPIRAGGGTRIKILEALSYGKPVVSTTLGAEGLELTPGVEWLQGDTSEEFADCCQRLMTDRALGKSIGEAGFRWVREKHTLGAARQALAAEMTR